MATTHDPPTLPAARSWRFLLRGQALHAAAAIVLSAVAVGLAAPALGDGQWAGVADRDWFLAGIGLSIAHQAYGWIAFRGQLGWGLFTRLFGRYDLAVHGAFFFPLLVARPLVVLGLGLADPGSLALPEWIQLVLGVALLVPAGYTLYSVARYFGPERALGGDHFRQSIRELPLVEAGAFAWTPNAMYTFAFLGLWSIGFLTGSHAALVAALFQHAFVWAHYLGTERPDMELIYGSGRD